jgi:hypothetical protein
MVIIIAPSKDIALEAEVSQVTKIQSISKAVHTDLGPRKATLFFKTKHNFIKIANTEPRKISLMVEGAQQTPCHLPLVLLRFPVNSREPPFETISFSNIDVNVHTSFPSELHLDTSPPQHRQATTLALTLLNDHMWHI